MLGDRMNTDTLVSMFERFKRYILKIRKIIRRPEMRILPGNTAFYLVLSLIPMITLLGIIGGYFTDSFKIVIDFIAKSLPQGVFDLLKPFLSNMVSKPDNMFFYICIGFFVASNGLNSIIIAANTLYHFDESDVIFRRVKAIFLTLILMILFVFILIFLAFSNVIYHVLTVLNFIKGVGFIFKIFRFLKWPLAFFMIFFVIRLIYTMAVNKRTPSKYFTKGALFTTFGFTLATAIYSFYANNLAHYDVFYGGLSNIIVMMIWFYVLSYILVVGMIINADVYKQVTEKNELN